MIRGGIVGDNRYEFGELVVDEEILDPTEVIKTHFPNGTTRTETVYKTVKMEHLESTTQKEKL